MEIVSHQAQIYPRKIENKKNENTMKFCSHPEILCPMASTNGANITTTEAQHNNAFYMLDCSE